MALGVESRVIDTSQSNRRTRGHNLPHPLIQNESKEN